MPVTTDPKDPRLGHGADEVPTPMQEVYLVLSEEERKKGMDQPIALVARCTALLQSLYGLMTAKWLELKGA